MPLDTVRAEENWNRYAYARDNGHLNYVRKANLCDQYFYGNQWREETRRMLEQQLKPVVTVNKVLASLLVVMGEMLQVQGDVSFQPTSSGSQESADALTKIYRAIQRSNAYQFTEAEVFDSGVIRSRGFFDIRLRFNDHLQGEVGIRRVNSKNVIVDADADTYDPDFWKEVFYTQWMTTNDIKINYNEEDGKALEARDPREYRFGVDSTDGLMNTFGGAMRVGYGHGAPNTYAPNAYPYYTGTANYGLDTNIRRLVRVIERQYKDVDKVEHFVDRKTGDMRPIPGAWTEEQIRSAVQAFDYLTMPKKIERIRFVTTADDRVLYDGWGPLKHFTFVPYFPIFHEGMTMGMVENMISPQDMLNKTLSQELHVINTTANSGWQMTEDQLVNMDPEDLETEGAKTGLVIVRRRGTDPLEKIQPNQIPSGLDRMSFKADEYTKEISGASDSKRGFDRSDVSGKATRLKNIAGSINFAKALFNLVQTRHLVARNVVDIVQEYYTEERLFRVSSKHLGGQDEEIRVNVVTPEGTVINDLTIGEYDVAVVDVPLTDTFEQSQFDEAVQLRELGIPIPDWVLIEASKLAKKHEIAAEIREANQGEASDPNAQELAALEIELKKADVATKQATAEKQKAEAAKAIADARATLQEAQNPDGGPTEGELQKEQIEAQAALQKAQADERMAQLQEQKLKAEIEAIRRKTEEEIRLQRIEAMRKDREARAKEKRDDEAAKAKLDSKGKE